MQGKWPTSLRSAQIIGSQAKIDAWKSGIHALFQPQELVAEMFQNP